MSEYVSVADTAKLVRGALRKSFPGVKFSVRSSRYAGGASIDVGWTDGPQRAAVDNAVQPYAGSGFDGMTDMKTGNYTWLYPDGHVLHMASGIGDSTGAAVSNMARTQLPTEQANEYMAAVMLATQGDTTRRYDPDSDAFAMGTADAASLTKAGARLVHFMADYIMTERTFSAEYRGELERAVVFLAGESGPFGGNRRYGFGLGIGGRRFEDHGNTLTYQLSQADESEVDAALDREAKRRADAAVTRFNAEHAEDRTGYYVGVQDGGRFGALLGPYATRSDAEADVPLGKRLAESVNDRAIWYAYGVTKVVMKPGQDLPAGKLEHLTERQMALAGAGPGAAPGGTIAAVSPAGRLVVIAQYSHRDIRGKEAS